MARATETGAQKVLIVDDSATNRQMLGGLLQTDYTVLLAKHGHEGLRLAQERQPDVILLDVMMPEVDGHEVLLERADERLCRAKKAGRNRVVGN